MSEEHVYLVYKVPSEREIDIGEFPDVGIFPAGELLAICETESAAEDQVDRLESEGPSPQFGDSIDDAPYEFSISERVLRTEGDQ